MSSHDPIPSQANSGLHQAQARRPLAVLRLNKLAQEHQTQWLKAIAEKKALPKPQPFIQRITDAGLRLQTFGHLSGYLNLCRDKCRDKNETPDPHKIITHLLPQKQVRPMLERLPEAA